MLWEALAGRHPVPRRQRSRDLAPDPGGRAGARRRAARPARLRCTPRSPPRSPRPRAPAAGGRARRPALRPSARKRRRQLRPSVDGARAAGPQIDRAAGRGAPAPAVFAAVWTGWVAASLPFYPAGWAVGLTIAAAADRAARSPRRASLFAFTATFFPLANISLGLALLFALIAARLDRADVERPAGQLVLVAGPLLAPLGALAFLPLVGAARPRAGRGARAQARPAPCSWRVVAGLRHQRAPVRRRLAAARARDHAAATGRPPSPAPSGAPLEAHPVVLAEAGVLAAAAVALPYAAGPRALGGGGRRRRAARRDGTRRARRPRSLPTRRGGLDHRGASCSPASAPAAERRAGDADSTSARSGPTRNRCSRLRRCETLPTFSPAGL